MRNFSVNWRNYGHWDIYGDKSRLFCIRGDPGAHYVRDERDKSDNKGSKYFKTAASCMGYICDELMSELTIIDRQTPQVDTEIRCNCAIYAIRENCRRYKNGKCTA